MSTDEDLRSLASPRPPMGDGVVSRPDPGVPAHPAAPAEAPHEAAPSRSTRRLVVPLLLTALLAGAVGGSATAWWVAGHASTPEPTSVPTVTRLVPPAPQTGPDGRVTAGVSDPITGLPALVERVMVSVVAIETAGTREDDYGIPVPEASSGTGFVIDANGLIATNYHVIEVASEITVTLSDGTLLAATVVGSDRAEDLAVLEVERAGLVPLTLAADLEVRVGEFVVAAGNALALEGSPTVTAGIISALDRSITASDGSTLRHLLQTDAAMSVGDSGGPLLTPSGVVIGINTAAATGTVAQNVGFAIPMSRAKPILFRLAGLTG